MPRLAPEGADQDFRARLDEVLAPYKREKRVSWLSEQINRNEATLRKWLRGDSEPNVSDLVALCSATNTRAGWLVVGEEPRSINEPLPKSYDLLDEKFLSGVVMVEEQAELLGLVLDPVRKGECLMEVYRALLSEPAKVTPKFVATTIKAFLS